MEGYFEDIFQVFNSVEIIFWQDIPILIQNIREKIYQIDKEKKRNFNKNNLNLNLIQLF
jgi:hypothetical protein